jgi:hypothetical protein
VKQITSVGFSSGMLEGREFGNESVEQLIEEFGNRLSAFGLVRATDQDK